MSTSIQRLLAHMAGDYVLQSHWLATEKVKSHTPAALHAASYTACFLPLTRNWKALAIIGGTHFVIDRWRLARHLVWLKNQVAPAAYRPEHTATGYGPDTPVWLSTWLMIIVDNSVHLGINEWALRRFR